MTTLRLPTASRPSANERRFRRALQWYPQAWRDQHGEAMLGVLLDVAEAGGTPGPSLAQRVDLARHGLTARLVGQFPARARDLAATSAFLGGTAFALFHLVFFSWAPWATYADPPFIPPLPAASAWPELIWLVAAACHLAGWRRTAKALVAVAGVTAVVLLLGRYVHPSWIWPHATTAAAQLIPAVFVFVGRVRTRDRMTSVLTVFALAAGFSAVYVLHTPGRPLITNWRGSDTLMWFVPYAYSERTIVLLMPVAFVILALALLASRRTHTASGLTALGMPWVLVWTIHGLHDSIFSTAGTLGPLGVTGERLLYALITATALVTLAAIWPRLERKALAHA